MNEQQKNGGTAGLSEPGTVLSSPAKLSGTDKAATGEATTSKRRSRASTKPVETGREPAEPKSKRSSSRRANAKNILVAAPGSVDVPVAKEALSDSAQRGADGPSPLPPAPVVTREGIEFMRQHMAYQHALEQRSAWQHARLQRAAQARNDALTRVARDNGSVDAQSNDASEHTAILALDAAETKTSAGTKATGSQPSKPARQNSIEEGPDIQKTTKETGPISFQDKEDQRTARLVLERSRVLKELRKEVSPGEATANLARMDVGAMNAVKDAPSRRLVLEAVKSNLNSQPAYRTEFEKIAPELARQALAFDIGKADSAPASGKASGMAQEIPTASMAVPDSVLRKFLKVDSEYYFPDRSPAFVDRGVRLATRGDHPEVVVALIDIARERGWNSITVKGTQSFRRAAWMEAARNGLQVTGYKPTELDLAQLRQREPANLIEPGAIREQKAAQPSAPAKPAERDGDPAASEKSNAFANERPTLAVKKYPDLIQAYALLDAARKFAAQHMPGHEDQFVAIGKALLTQQIRQGISVVGPKIHADRIDKSRSESEIPQRRTEGKRQSQEMVRER